MKKFKHDTSNVHELIRLTAVLNYQLRIAEETRKLIANLSLKVKRKK